MKDLYNIIREQVPTHWRVVPFWSLYKKVKFTGFSEEELLSVYRDYGVIPKSSRDCIPSAQVGQIVHHC